MPESSREPPGQNALKININGSMNDALATGGWGFIVRDSQGHALGAGVGYMLHSKTLYMQKQWRVSRACRLPRHGVY